MPQLATPDDLAVRLGATFTTEEAYRASALLDDASATVTDYTGQTFAVDDYTFTATPCAGYVTLPNGPVVSVGTVVDADDAAVPFTWSEGRKVGVSTFAEVTITYSAGWAVVPQTVIAVICQIAGRAYGTNASEGGITQESLGAWAHTRGVIAAAGTVGLLPDERATLDRYRSGNKPRTIYTPPWLTTP